MIVNRPLTRRTSLLRAVCLFTTSFFHHLNSPSFFTVYQPTLRAKSDADIIRDARREALGLPPAPEDEDRARGPRMATDEVVMERFKKRMRK